MEPNVEKSGVVFGVETNVAPKGSNAAQKREHDKRIGSGTMSRSGAKCPCCGTIMTTEDIRLESMAGRLTTLMTAVVVDGLNGKEYRPPTEHEIQVAEVLQKDLAEVFNQLPFGLPTEPTPKGVSRKGGGSAFTVHLYGIDKWHKLFSSRQLLALGTFIKWTRAVREHCDPKLTLPITAYLSAAIDRMGDRNSMLCWWQTTAEKVASTFTRFALPMTWDFNEINPFADSSGGYVQAIEWEAEFLEHVLQIACPTTPAVTNVSGMRVSDTTDIVITDPPYYDAIPYSDLMDFFYIWLRRSLHGLSPDMNASFHNWLSPKWDHEKQDGELIDDASRHGGDRVKSKAAYEDGMEKVFRACHDVLVPEGRLVIVFAHKHPDAWEALVSATLRAGFVVDGSWPITTERVGRIRANSSAALSSSVWLVCKKRPPAARPGWDNQVLEDMRRNIRERLREYWDEGIRGPDFVWAATGPAMEAYSKHPVVKKANEPGPMTVSEFLTHVRRMVVDFVVGRVLSGDKDADEDSAAADRLDEPTAYYLLHRHDFGMEDAPAGACILYAISCGLSDRELSATWDLIAHTSGKAEADEAEESSADSDEESEEDTGSKMKLKTWAQRRGKSLGYEAPGGKSIPLIDRVHCLMHLWKAGNLLKVDEYLDSNGLRRQELFKRLLQSLIELSPHGSEERSLLESLSNHIGARGAVRDKLPRLFTLENPEETEVES